MKKKILITTGGSGGHAIPATILFDHLKNNFEVFLETDKRGASFIDSKKYKYKVFSSVKLDSFFSCSPKEKKGGGRRGKIILQ